MAKYRVKVLRLNVRTSPVSNTADKSNISREVLQGFMFESIDSATNALGVWYQDAKKLWYWGGGVEEVVAEEIPPAIIPIVESALPWWIADYGIDNIWDITKGENVKIAVLDSGYNVNIQDIAKNVKYEWVYPNADGITINDTYGHGSHCAALAANSNIVNVISYAPESELYIAKLSEQGSINFSTLNSAIQWAINKKVDIISISNGSELYNQELQHMLTTAVANNIIVVASIGNIVKHSTNKPCYPALFSECIAVGATTREKYMSAKTIVSEKTEINAPGDAIYSYWKTEVPEPKTGTSQATALVAGLCALIVSHYKASGQLYTAESLKQLLMQYSQPVLDSPSQKLIDPKAIFSHLTSTSIL